METVSAEAIGIRAVFPGGQELILEWSEIQSIHLSTLAGTEQTFLFLEIDHLNGEFTEIESSVAGFWDLVESLSQYLPLRVSPPPATDLAFVDGIEIGLFDRSAQVSADNGRAGV